MAFVRRFLPREDRTAVATGVALVVVTIAAWVGLVGYAPPMGMAGFIVGWTLMMTAMMLPSIAPLVLLHRGRRERLVAGYLALWGVTGVLPYAAMELGFRPALPIVLGLAGGYELSPLKSTCLRRCRNPAAFLMEHYRSGPFRLGVEHGAWCLGCCVGLMAVLVLAASMDLGWAAVIAAVVFIQKVLPFGEVSARLAGGALIVAAAAIAVV